MIKGASKKIFVSLVLCITALVLIVAFGRYSKAVRAKYQLASTAAYEDMPTLSEEQMAFISDNVPKLLQWDEYWTSDDHELNGGPSSKSNKTVPIKIASLKGAVIVFIPPAFNSAIIYVRMPDGTLDYPGFVSWLGIKNGNDIGEIMKRPLSSTSWSLFKNLLISSEGNKLKITPEQKQMYLTLFNDDLQFREYDGAITLLPTGSPVYLPTNDDKELLLEQITKMSVQEANKSYKPDQLIRMTIPNFNVGDPIVFVLMEPPDGHGIIIRVQLTTTPKQGAVIFAGVSNWDTEATRNGVKDITAERIKQRALKTFDYKVGSISLNPQ